MGCKGCGGVLRWVASPAEQGPHRLRYTVAGLVLACHRGVDARGSFPPPHLAPSPPHPSAGPSDNPRVGPVGGSIRGWGSGAASPRGVPAPRGLACTGSATMVAELRCSPGSAGGLAPGRAWASPRDPLNPLCVPDLGSGLAPQRGAQVGPAYCIRGVQPSLSGTVLCGILGHLVDIVGEVP